MLRYLEHPLKLPAYQHSFHLSSIPLILPTVVSPLVRLQLFFSMGVAGEDELRGRGRHAIYVHKKRQLKQKDNKNCVNTHTVSSNKTYLDNASHILFMGN